MLGDFEGHDLASAFIKVAQWPLRTLAHHSLLCALVKTKFSLRLWALGEPGPPVVRRLLYARREWTVLGNLLFLE